MTIKAEDYTILDNVSGRGQYIGTYVGIAALERYWWGEGEMKFYLDGDVEYPTICGTGTEDYFGGAWSYAGFKDGKFQEQNFCTPFIGYPFYSKMILCINPVTLMMTVLLCVDYTGGILWILYALKRYPCNNAANWVISIWIV